MPDRGEGAAGHHRRGHRPSRAAVALLIVLGVLAVLATGFVTLAGLWTDLLWYRSVRYSSVFSTVTWTKADLFVSFGLLMALSVGLNMYLAHRLRPPLSAMSSEQQSLDRYRMGLAPYKGWVLLAVSGALGLVAGGVAAGQWRKWLLMVHSTPFHTRDPQFHKDVSFYTFRLPWYRFLVGYGFAVVILSLLGAVAVHYLYGGLRLTSPGTRVTSAATRHLAVLLGLFVSLKAAAYWLDRYKLAVRSSGYRTADNWTGLRYVDANAYLPAKTILFFVAVICALLFFATVWRRDWSLPAVGLGLMVLSAILVGGLYPAVMQKFQVQPNEAAKEAPYVQKNIDATRAAYGLADVKVTPYPGRPSAAATAAAQDGGKGTRAAARTVAGAGLRADADASASVGVLDPNVVSPAFQQLQGSGSYQFPSTLDVDHYSAGGADQDAVVGVRELNPGGIPKDDWIDDHVRYTHGYGVVAAQGSGVDGRGAPVFGGPGLPAAGPSADYQQRIYYGEQTRRYAIVGGTTPEVDYADQAGITYGGKGGVSLRSPLTRAAYAISFGEPRIFSSGAVGADSRILYNRTPKERVAAVAPWLAIDGDPYPVVVGKKVLWVVDGYTTSDSYPYASRTSLGGATADSLTDGRRAVLAGQDQVNYIRNSVKATVDAYDGTVTLYQWDTADPVLATWMKAFPHTVRSRADIPAELLGHLRYPQDLFKVQRQMLTSYHVTKAADFANGSQVWKVPGDPAARTGKAVPPYYMSLRMPDQNARTFSLTTTFTAGDQEHLSAFMAVDADATSPGYGTLRLLQMPAAPAVGGLGPAQAKIGAAARSDPGIARLKGRGSDSAVVYGNLLTVPLDGGLLYVEPVYVRGSGDDYPLLGGVVALYDGRTACGPTLSQALDALLAPAPGTASPKSRPGAAAPPGAGTPLQQALADAQKAMDDSDAAMKRGDWDAYGDAQRRLATALQQARAAATAADKAAGTGDTPKASPTPTKKG